MTTTLDFRFRFPFFFLFLFVALASLYARPASAQTGICQSGKKCSVRDLTTTGGAVSICPTCTTADQGMWSYRGSLFGMSAVGSGTAARLYANSGQWDFYADHLVAPGYITTPSYFASTVGSGFGAFVAPTGAKYCLDGATCADHLKDNGGATWVATLLQLNANYAQQSLPSPTTYGGGLAYSTNGVQWMAHGNMWRDLQSGAHPSLDGMTFAARPGLESGNCHLVTMPGAAVNGTAATMTCTNAAGAAATSVYDGNSRRVFRAAATQAAAGASTSVVTSTIVEMRNSPRACAWVLTDSALTARRYFVGLAASAYTNSDTVPNQSMGFRYSSVAGDTNWMLCTADAATASCTSTGVPVAASRSYLLCVDARTSGTVYGSAFNPAGPTYAAVAKTTNLPVEATASPLSLQTYGFSTGGAATDFLIGPLSVEGL